MASTGKGWLVARLYNSMFQHSRLKWIEDVYLDRKEMSRAIFIETTQT